jgi:gliding motility-associated-like protein
MKKLVLLFSVLLITITNLKSQNCFTINSLLVDACGTPEGENEMVRFTVGPVPLQVSTLNVTWPTTTLNFLGICQNANTAQKVAALNASIQSCGYILEPVGGVLPAGSKVIMVTSENFNTTFNSFANLTDTIYMIFQCAGNTQGHFRNYSATVTTPRILTMNFGAVCSQSVSYYPNQLVNQFGQLDTAAQDGSSVAYDSLGNVTSYYNNGCQAPIITLTADLTASSNTICSDDTVYLAASNLTGNYSGYFWSGGSGNYSQPGSLTPYYFTALNSGVDTLKFNLLGQCNDTITYNLYITVQNGQPASISGPTTVCTGSSITLTSSAGTSYLWSTGATTPSITVTNAGTYTVTVSGTCGNPTASTTITSETTPSITVLPGTSVSICQGQSVVLTASGATSYLWSTGATTSSISVNTAGSYTVSSTNNCGTSSVTVNVTTTTTPVVNVSSNGGTILCPGQSLTLTASGADTYVWSGGQTTSSITINAPGIYTVTGTSSCGTASGSITITQGTAPSISVSPGTSINICAGQSATLTASGASTYNWSNGATTASINVNSAGVYTVYSSNTCGTDSVVVTVTVTNTPSVTISASQPVICPGQQITLSASGASTYVWSGGQNTASITVNAAGVYTVTGTSTCGTASATFNLVQGAPPVAEITAATNVLCSNSSLTLSASGGTTYLWSNGTSGSSININLPGQYSVYATNTCGSDTADFTVVASPLLAAFTASTYNGQAPLSINFTNNSIAYTSSSWNFGNGNTASTTDAVNLFNYGGVFNVILTVADDNGCTDTASAVISVVDDTLKIPNVITPNNDGKNDVFTFNSTAIKSADVTIYNRWGNKVASYSDWKKGWDADKQQAGVYYYVIEINQYNGETKKIHGALNVIR